MGSPLALLFFTLDPNVSTFTLVKFNDYLIEWKLEVGTEKFQSRAKVQIWCYFDLITLPETCTVAKPIFSLCHSYRFPMLHLPMRKSLQNSHHHLILHESQQGPWEMLKWFPSHFSLNLIWAFNDLLQNAVVYITSNNKLSVKFLVGQTAILIEKMMKNIKMEKLCQ